MNVLLEHALTNAALAVPLAALAWFSRALRRPAWTHALWVLVLVRLVAPPLGCLPRAWFVPSSGVRAEGPAQTAGWPALSPRRPSLAVAPDGVVHALDKSGASQSLSPGHPLVVEEVEDALSVVMEDPTVEVAAPDVDPAPMPPAASWPWQPIIVGAWLAGAVGCCALAAVRLWRFQQLLNCARPAPAAWQRTADRLAQRLGLPRAPGVWLVPGAVPPLLWSLAGRPRLLLPDGLLHALEPVPRAAVLAHELAHLRRRDPWVRWLELAATSLYWWHPLAWWAGRELRDAEEECCDAWVVWALPGARRAYATTLMDALDFLSNARPALPPLASGFGRVGHLRRRLTMIMCGTGSGGLGWAGRAAVFGLGVLLVALGPGRAQDGPKPPEPPARPDGSAAEDRRARVEDEARRAVEAFAAAREAGLARAMEELRRAEAEAKRAQERVAELRQRLDRTARDLDRNRRGADGAAPVAPGQARREGPPEVPSPEGPVRPRSEAQGVGVGRGRFGPGDGPVGLPGGFAGGGGFGGGPGAAFGAERRIENLERQLDGLRRELTELRRELRRPPEPRPASAGAEPKP